MNQPLRVLVVMDEPDDLELVVRSLEAVGGGLEWTAVDTRGAFEAKLAWGPDLIVTDRRLGVLVGLIGGRDTGVPVVVLSGHALRELRRLDDALARARTARRAS